MVELFKEAMNIIEGVRPDKDSEFIIDMNSDFNDDIIDTVLSDDIKIKSISENTYWFGYEFKPNVSSSTRTKFINWLKSIKFETQELDNFLSRPLYYLFNEIGAPDFDLIISPKSERSKLVSFILSAIYRITPRSTKRESIEVIKNLPGDISFDYNGLRDWCNYDYQYRECKKYIDTELMPKIKSLEYFSMAQNVPSKYRKFITDFLTIGEYESDAIRQIQKGNILIVDDINTSGSTIDEIVRIIKTVNKDCKIYIFTLIGK